LIDDNTIVNLDTHKYIYLGLKNSQVFVRPDNSVVTVKIELQSIELHSQLGIIKKVKWLDIYDYHHNLDVFIDKNLQCYRLVEHHFKYKFEQIVFPTNFGYNYVVDCRYAPEYIRFIMKTIAGYLLRYLPSELVFTNIYQYIFYS